MYKRKYEAYGKVIRILKKVKTLEDDKKSLEAEAKRHTRLAVTTAVVTAQRRALADVLARKAGDIAAAVIANAGPRVGHSFSLALTDEICMEKLVGGDATPQAVANFCIGRLQQLARTDPSVVPVAALGGLISAVAAASAQPAAASAKPAACARK
jgi:hypothetical protein